ncbi:hypothetical protein [Rhodococcus sp. AH-ZY2]|uniref:hypothetical protein n=1 Tax=Rhodococcus sp. AH-ZY2 TaxID=3047468 RepID=UPI0027DF7FE1|nr:hypothetical protein [Rhodococcus sp. AH-ZY2]WML62156.1 hypothetical protein QNA09_20240 [Rhodococcus sp. AH-ZY2]
MTVTAPETDRLNAFMGIDTVSGEPGTVSFRQPLGARFVDHRGRTTVDPSACSPTSFSAPPRTSCGAGRAATPGPS